MTLWIRLEQIFGKRKRASGVVPGSAPTTRTCPICGWEGTEFLPCNARFAHDDSRQLSSNCKCPECGSHHRHRGFMLVLQKFDLPQPGAEILHVAPEGFMEAYFDDRADRYVRIDKHIEGRRSGNVTEMDLTDLEFSDRSFDFIFCSHVLEHIPDDRKAIAEVYRVLRPGGVALLMVPVYPLEKTADLYHLSPDIQTHVHQPGRDYFQRYEDAGFSVTVRYPEELFDREKYGLRAEWDPVAVCLKD